MTLKELAKVVADDFKREMAEHDCDTFEEMVDLFWWTPKEIKTEVDYIIRNASNGEAYIDELDGTLVCAPGEDMTYRKFASMWRKNLK